MKIATDTHSTRLALAADVLRHESNAISALIGRLNSNFERAAELILATRGRVIVTGMGKSGLVGQKVAATLSSTGTPAFFLHPVEAGHGDLGVVSSDDVVLAISKSAESEEVAGLLPAFKRLGTPIILITGNPAGDLVRRSDVVLDASVDHEAEPHDLVPTCSTTAALALGDALAIVLMTERGITPDDFARFHPRGSLGRRLLLTVGDVMHTGAQVPAVPEGASFKELLVEMTRKRLGCAAIVDDANHLIGIFTDGDLRRQMEQRRDLFSLRATELMTRNPRTVNKSQLAVTALSLMEDAKITVLLVIDESGRLEGVVHMHDLLSTGTV